MDLLEDEEDQEEQEEHSIVVAAEKTIDKNKIFYLNTANLANSNYKRMLQCTEAALKLTIEMCKGDPQYVIEHIREIYPFEVCR